MWQPTYWCFGDPIQSYTETEIEKVNGCIHAASPKAFFVPLGVRPLIFDRLIFPAESTFFTGFGGVSVSDWQADQELDFTRLIPGGYSTAHLALMLAIFMGCSPIYLLGLDHDWLAHRSHVKHCYDSHVKEPDKYSNNLALSSYKTLMEIVLSIWETYELLQSIASRKGLVIYNATNGGFLDVFEQVRYESLFETPKP